MFHAYNPDMLQQLRYDDDLADFAAQSSGGRPAYCDSRYYRAIANGGQGKPKLCILYLHLLYSSIYDPVQTQIY